MEHDSGLSTQGTIYPLNTREDGNICLLTSVPYRSRGILWGINFLGHPACTRVSTRQFLLEEPCKKGQRRSLAERGNGTE